MIQILLILFLTQPTEAGMIKWLKNTCAKHLIAEDIWPFAEYSNEGVLFHYRLTLDKKAGKEIKYRVEHGLMPFEMAKDAMFFISYMVEE